MRLSLALLAWKGGGVTPLYINVYMCAHVLFIRGLYFVENIIRHDISQNKDRCLYFNAPCQ